MDVLHIYKDDLKIASDIIARNADVTKRFLYVKCYPLFKSFYDNYETDCKNCIEFIDEIYVIIIKPSKKTGRCQLMNYRGESTLTSWLKTVCLYYCYEKYKIKTRIPIVCPIQNSDDEKKSGDRFVEKSSSTEIDFSGMNHLDIEALLKLMPNTRYRSIIRMRYVEHKTNEETAGLLGMTMENFYNKHKLAKAQYEDVCRKEEKRHG